MAKLTQNVFITFQVTPTIMAQGTLVAAALGIIASIAPSLSVAKTTVVEGLKTLD